jgi:hypothetical protein
MIQPSLDKKGDLISKIKKAKRAEGEVQEVEYLSSKCEALSSNPSTAKKKKKRKKERKKMGIQKLYN